MKKLLFFLFLLTCSFQLMLHAQFPILPEAGKDLQITTEAELQDESYAQAIESFYKSGEEGYFEGQAGVSIYFKRFRNPGNMEKAILISSGRTEAAIKYKELIFDLFKQGFSIYIHDHRGQGRSGRMTEDEQMGYVDLFQYYVDDMKCFYDDYIKENGHRKIFLLAHSMGGAIGMRYLEQYPTDFQAASFCSPMLGLAPYICPLAAVFSGKKPKYAMGQGPYAPGSFEGNDVSGSRIRFERNTAATAAAPETRLGGASYQWLHRSCQAFKPLFREIDQIQSPFILFSAENETVVHPQAHARFIKKAKKLGKECEAYLVKDARHEILMEKDSQRAAMIQAMLDFFARH